MDEKVLFVADYLRQVDSFTGLCQRYGISRKTGYKLVQRYQQQGVDGLEERSRRPHHLPAQLPYVVQQSILELRQRGRQEMGPKKIQALLKRRHPEQPMPSRTTIYNVLKRAGLIKPRHQRRRVAPSATAPRPADAPNELWSADFKGQFLTRDGRWCYPLTVMDHASRYLLACQALPGPRLEQTQSVFRDLFRQQGLPQRLRTDNGVPFATTACGGLSRLSIWWIRLGIQPERITPGRPQQNGRHERMHRTLKRDATRPPAAHAKAQQRCFDGFRNQYNTQRPHEALLQRPPASVYRASTRAYPERLPDLHYPDHLGLRRVCGTGLVYWRGRAIYVGYLLANEQIGLEQVDDGVWTVYFGPVRLGQFDERLASSSRSCLTLKKCHLCV